MRCTLLEVDSLSRLPEHTTLRLPSEMTVRATDDVLCYLIIISSQLSFINTSLIKQTKNMIVCYQNNIENKVCHNSGHATIAAPIGYSVVDDRQLCGCITYTIFQYRISISMPIAVFVYLFWIQNRVAYRK